jgi:hypothetical protein
MLLASLMLEHSLELHNRPVCTFANELKLLYTARFER